MEVLVLIVMLAGAFALDQAWNRHRVRAYYAVLGHTVESIVWRPLAGLLSFRTRRGDSVYEVRHTTRDGVERTSRCVTAFWAGIRADELIFERTPTSERSGFAPASRPARFDPRFHLVCLASAVVSCLAIGATYWTAEYNSLDLPSGLFQPGFVLIPLFAFALAAWRPDRMLTVVAASTSAVVAVVVLRIAMDFARDPTTHNLFPFEIAIAVFVGGVASALPVGCARLARWVIGPREGPRRVVGGRYRS